jgi:hypothetical protein
MDQPANYESILQKLEVACAAFQVLNQAKATLLFLLSPFTHHKASYPLLLLNFCTKQTLLN